MDKETCYHCGDTCGSDSVEYDEKQFCCVGCQTVFKILDDNNLNTFYDLENSPGVSLRQKASVSDKYAYLDQEEIVDQLIDFRLENQIHFKLYLPQIHCKSCVWLLEKLYLLYPAIQESKVDFIRKEVYLVVDSSQMSFRTIVEKLTDLGYEPLIRLSSKDKQQSRWDKRLLIQVGITGFCFGNIMMLSFPEYLPGGEELEKTYSTLFSYISFVFAVPVLFIGAKDYLKSAWIALREKYINLDIPISIGIIALFLSSSLEVFINHKIGYFDSFGGLIFFLLLGKLFQQQTFYQFSFDRDYKSYFPIAVRRKNGDDSEQVPIENIDVGDHLIIRKGELIPADGQLLTNKLEIDYSFVTGEAKSVLINVSDKVYAGGKSLSDIAELRVTKKPKNSYLTSLWNKIENKKIVKADSSLDKLSNKVSKYFTIVILCLAIGTLSYWALYDVSKAIYAFTSVLIVACPCALALSIPFTYGNAMRILGKRGVFLKSAEVIEKLNKVKHVVFDKTGTLTDQESYSVKYLGETLTYEEMRGVLSLANLSRHPLSQILVKEFSGSFESDDITSFEEIEGKGLEAFINSKKYKVGSAEFVGSEVSQGTSVFVSIDGKIKGVFVFEFELRKGVRAMITSLGRGLGLSVLSGDNNTSEKDLRDVFGDKAKLNFNQSPHDKLEYIEQLEEDKASLMIGDGLNDSGALRMATVGVSVTTDVTNFTPASDVIIFSDQVQYLDKILNLSSKTVFVVYVNFLISFAYNFVGLVFAITGQLSPIIAAVLMPVSSITVVIVSILATNFIYKKYKY